ncbi:glycosyltransferase family 4 protein [Phenylobacterium sp.]|jgi:D-inositol-3-phosphate glycosyltransferase|uniref:glycosyltransferase family 4 protein n=1 Tax=Phenylobacterium sp. TaxID=1871053 RepID=UPI0037C7CE80
MTGAAAAAFPRDRLAILHPPGRMGLGVNPFGKDVANLQLWQALARHGGWSRIDVLGFQPPDPAELSRALFGSTPAACEIGAGVVTTSGAPQAAGLLLRGQPELQDLAWMRRRQAGDRAYSLVGLIHTLAPPAMRQMIANTQVAPMHDWDALICTSPSVRDNVASMFEGFGEHLAQRTGGRAPSIPRLPVIPLGVDAAGFAAKAERTGARARLRAELDLSAEDVLVLWVGRLSYYEKAFPQPMFQAMARAQVISGKRLVFAMAGWFPDAGDRNLYEAAVRAHAPEVTVRFEDGNDQARLADLWAGADIFLSLVDNIQETFGITPLEAMAAGLPVVASDWDGYRSTMRTGIEGFLIPTLGGPTGGGLGAAYVEHHAVGASSYQSYVGAIAQYTAVHVALAAEALAALAGDIDLRRRMGAAGRARVMECFDWPVVARLYHGLADELSAVRAASADPARMPAADPVKSDPFRAFAHFATHALTPATRLRAADGSTVAAVQALNTVQLDAGFPSRRASIEICARAFELIAAAPSGLTAREVLERFPVAERRALELGLAWMAKYGLLDWLS